MLTRLKYKCVITLESLCEGQNDPEILKKIMKNLNLEILKDNLGWLFEKKEKIYEQKYNMELFNHVDMDENKEENRYKVNFIIETGFKIFFILRKYLEAVKIDDDEGIAKSIFFFNF
jgi:hypothetical protein